MFNKKIHTDITIDNDLFIKGNGNLLGNGKDITLVVIGHMQKE